MSKPIDNQSISDSVRVFNSMFIQVLHERRTLSSQVSIQVSQIQDLKFALESSLDTIEQLQNKLMTVQELTQDSFQIKSTGGKL